MHWNGRWRRRPQKEGRRINADHSSFSTAPAGGELQESHFSMRPRSEFNSTAYRQSPVRDAGPGAPVAQAVKKSMKRMAGTLRNMVDVLSGDELNGCRRI